MAISRSVLFKIVLPRPVFGRPASVGPSVVGPLRCPGDQPVPAPLWSSFVLPEVGIHGCWPTIRSAPDGPLVSATRVPFAYSGWGPHPGQWSSDPPRSERLTPPLGPSLVSWTLLWFPTSIVHPVSSLSPVGPPGCYRLNLDRAHPWPAVDPMIVTFIPATPVRTPSLSRALAASMLDCTARNIATIATLFSCSASRSCLSTPDSCPQSLLSVCPLAAVAAPSVPDRQ